MIDDWRHTPPLGIVGRAVDVLLLGRLLRRQLEIRNGALAREAEAAASLS